MTMLERMDKLPTGHKMALASLLSLVAEKYIVAAEKEIRNAG